jgi:hypothetical protein
VSRDYIFGLGLAIGFAIGFFMAVFFMAGFLVVFAAIFMAGAGDAAIAGTAEAMNAVAQSAIRIRFIIG